MVRLALLIGVLAACGGGSNRPTWPKASASDSDGGESLAPKPGSIAVSASDDDDDDDIVIEKPTEKPAAVKATEPSESPRPTAPTVTAPDDVINTDDLVIEIDD